MPPTQKPSHPKTSSSNPLEEQSLWGLAVSHAMERYPWSPIWEAAYQKFLDSDTRPGAGDRLIAEVVEAFDNVIQANMTPRPSWEKMQGLVNLTRSRWGSWPTDHDHLKHIWTTKRIEALPSPWLLALSDAGLSFHDSSVAILRIFKHSPGHPRVPILLQDLDRHSSGGSIHEWLLCNLIDDYGILKIGTHQPKEWRVHVLAHIDLTKMMLASFFSNKVMEHVKQMETTLGSQARVVFEAWNQHHPQALKHLTNQIATNERDRLLAQTPGLQTAYQIDRVLAYTDPAHAALLKNDCPALMEKYPVLEALASRHEMLSVLSSANHEPSRSKM